MTAKNCTVTVEVTVRTLCDVCGETATNVAADIREEYSEDGWRHYTLYGNVRHGCDKHISKPSQTYDVYGELVS